MSVRLSVYVFGLIIALVAYFVLLDDDVLTEVTTIPYSRLSEVQWRSLDRLDNNVDGYDPRRSSVSVLKYLEENCVDDGCKVPLSWEQLIDIGNKTEEGIEVLENSVIEKLVIMKNQIYQYEVDFENSLELIDRVESISETIDNFFIKDDPIDYNFKEIELTHADFDASDSLAHLKKLKNQVQRDYLLSIYEAETIKEFRYFKEGSILHNSTLHISGLSHYDLRFYYNKIEPIDRVSILHRIARSWAKFTRLNDMQTWIAHGSLLGYYFNGLILPWDDDLDVQITLTSFYDLLEYNGTLVIDYEDHLNPGKYLIDINPWFLKRDGYSPGNKIDARFIDLESGLYIDITVLTVNEQIESLEQLNELSIGNNKRLELSKIFEPFYEDIVTETINLQQKINSTINSTLQSKELISCKDYHFYKIEELTPLIPNIFEGEILLTPKSIKELLIREYKRKSIYLHEFNGFQFDKIKNLWISDNGLRYETNSELDNFINHHYDAQQTTNFRQNTISPQILKQFKPFRVEPWIRQRLAN